MGRVSRLPIFHRRSSIFLPEGPGEIGVVSKAAVLRDIDDLKSCLRQLSGRQIQTVIHQVGIKTHACKFPE